MGEIGLFPLDIVLLPHERVPLHIFEERYKELIGECLENGSEFGIVFAEPDGVRSIGTRAAVVEVLQRFPDGRLNIIIQGGDRLHVEEVTEGRPYTTAVVADLPDQPDEAPERGEVLACLAAYRRVAEVDGAKPDEFDPDDRSLAFQIAGRVDFSPAAKQELLEMLSERARLARLTEMLEQASEAIAIRQMIRKRAAGNGHIEGN
jgi:Lon protease-like protein